MSRDAANSTEQNQENTEEVRDNIRAAFKEVCEECEEKQKLLERLFFDDKASIADFSNDEINQLVGTLIPDLANSGKLDATQYGMMNTRLSNLRPSEEGKGRTTVNFMLIQLNKSIIGSTLGSLRSRVYESDDLHHKITTYQPDAGEVIYNLFNVWNDNKGSVTTYMKRFLRGTMFRTIRRLQNYDDHFQFSIDDPVADSNGVDVDAGILREEDIQELTNTIKSLPHNHLERVIVESLIAGRIVMRRKNTETGEEEGLNPKTYEEILDFINHHTDSTSSRRFKDILTQATTTAIRTLSNIIQPSGTITISDHNVEMLKNNFMNILKSHIEKNNHPDNGTVNYR